MNIQEKISWCIKQHQQTSHYYDNYLPYEFHLRMVVRVFEEFKHLLPINLYTTSEEVHRGIWETEDITHKIIELSGWGHDLIEDARVSYNDCRNALGTDVADIIYAVTNEKGKTRQERANDKYYHGIIETPGAVFTKICDRIANVRYGKLTKSRRMLETYQKENNHFCSVLSQNEPTLKPMFDCLTILFQDNYRI